MPAARYEVFLATRHFGSLDGLRALCIAAVLWHHGPVWTELADPARILTRGFMGVDFFFVLSGFLITTLLLREERAYGRISLAGFYRRRILRIVPVYFLVVTGVATYYILLKGQHEYLSILPYYYLFLSNFLVGDIPTLAPTWSLSVEEQYYMIWPLALILTPRRWIGWLLLAVIAINVMGAMGVFAPLGIHAFDLGPLNIHLPTATYAPILIGSGAALLLDNPHGFRAAAAILGRRLAPLACFAALLILWQFGPANVRGLPNLAIHLVMTACLISIVVREDNILRPLLGLRPIARVGEISYGIYLYHLLALDVVNRLGIGGPWFVTIAYSLLAIAIAEFSFRTFEAYFRRLRHKKSETVAA